MSSKVLKAEFGVFFPPPDLSEGSGFKLQFSFICAGTETAETGGETDYFYVAETSDGPGRAAAVNWTRRRRATWVLF